MAYDLYEAGPASSQFGYALSLVACDMVARTDGPQAPLLTRQLGLCERERRLGEVVG
jgi:hypothetical protein